MAQCWCRWGKVLLCLCSPCILLAFLVLYVTLVMCYNRNYSGTGVLPTHFIAAGASRTDGLAPHPNSFWDLDPHKGAVWNKLQRLIDLRYNPIFRPKPSKEDNNNKTVNEYSRSQSLLSAGFSEIGDMEARMADFSSLPQQMRDFVHSMHSREYPILIEPPRARCWAGEVKQKRAHILLLAIKTQELNFERRQAIRQTWGQAKWVTGVRGSGGNVQRVFLLGKNHTEKNGSSAGSVDTSKLLEKESQIYGDILQWDFHDSFFNLTLKDVLFWDWFSDHCPDARFVFKGDDDILVHTPALLDYLRKQTTLAGGIRDLGGFVVGEVINAAKPNRVATTKYFVPASFYKGLYPSYLGGGGVVYSGTLAKQLHLISRRVHLFPIDDVFLGMCLHRLQVHPIHHPAFLTFDFPKKEGEKPCAYHTILMVHKRSPDQIIRLWAELQATQAQCRNTALRKGEVK